MMNTAVWIMLLASHGYNMTAGPEFSSKEKCEKASVVMTRAFDEKRLIGKSQPPICVKIEK